MSLFKGIGWRIFVSFSLLCVSLVLVIGYLGLRSSYDAIYGNAANEIRVLSVTLAQLLQRYLWRAEAALKSLQSHGALVTALAEQGPVTPESEAEVEAFLRARLASFKELSHLSLFNRSGHCVASTDPDWHDVDIKGQPFFTAGLKAFHFAEIFDSSDEGKIQLVSTPVTNGVAVRGVLVGQINLKEIYELMDQKLEVVPDSEAFVLDKRLRFITSGVSGPQDLMESHLASTPLARHLRETFWVGRYSSYDGSEVLGTAYKLPSSDWYVVIERRFDAINDQITRILVIMSAITGVLLIAVVAITYGLTSSITRPVRALVESARQISEGDLSRPLVVPRASPEIAFLAREFDGMRAKIASYQERLLAQLRTSEERRITSERLAAVGALAASLAHEIRNPLNAMSLLIANFEHQKSGEEKSRRIITTMREEIARLDRLVTNVLEYAKPVNLARQRVGLAALCREVAEFYRPSIVEKGLRLEVVAPTAEVVAVTDRDRVKQCVVNLLQNAIEAAPHGTAIEIKISSDAHFGRVTVTDEGAGLTPEASEHVFDLFFTTKETGTGLGLSTVKKIVLAAGGDVTITNRAEHGAQAEIAIPLDLQI